MKSKNISLIALSLFTICLLFGKNDGLAVMSVDIGSEWFKVAIVSVSVNYLNKILTIYLRNTFFWLFVNIFKC